MADPFRKVRTGDPLRIPAAAYNAFIDAAHLARRIDPDALRAPPLTAAQEHLVLVRNDSGEDLPRFGILGIARPIVEPGTEGNEDEFKRRAAVIGAAITATDEYVGRFVVAREPIASGRIGLAVVRGVTAAMVNVTDNEHGHADTYPNEQLLRSGFTGAARILWKEPGTGQKLAVVEIGPADRDRFAARLGPGHLIDGRTFGWLYEWEEVRLDADPFSFSFGQYVRPSGAAAEGWLTSAGHPARLAFNRYEAHLPVMHPQAGGTEGFARAGACITPGPLEHCPPRRAAVPLLHPIPEGVVVELRAERTLRGETRFVFEALNPVVLSDMQVPEGWYG
jgi:hypothetical protein